ncbi:MAG: FAD:protein FMN transferase [Candidatus Saccharibacteria bacterium]|nr:FAD:protein FMN transferase [Candidatus Saccharibacteria bacterium]
MRLREVSQTKLALGSNVVIAIITDMSGKEIDKIFEDLWLQVFTFERKFSRFIPKSELTLFNRLQGIRTNISPEFKDLLIYTKQLSEETNGLFNPFILPLLQKAGYMKSAVPGFENDAKIDFSAGRLVGVDKLEIGDDWATIPYGTAIEMGGIGKGYLADQLHRTLDSLSIQGYWMSLGGDVATSGKDLNGNSLSLNIQSAKNLDEKSDWVIDCPIKYSAAATSGTFKRKNQFSDKTWHHIINPLTLEPAVTDIRLATICADTATRADVLASCAVILGSKKAPTFLKKHGIKSALLQCVDRDGVDFEVRFGPRIRRA